jgi:osmoprotectant transport system permease protein
VASVSNVSLVAVASTIGVSQLGQLFVAGDNAAVDGQTPIILGLIMFILLALVLDLAILLGIRVLAPWRRAVSR